jgi:AcrR family transcriptional regulator
MMAPVAVNRQTVPRAEREAAIVDAALAEFVAHGFDDAKVADVARRAGMTSANVHYYFPTKDDLVTAVTERAFTELFAELDRLEDPVERLHRFVAFHLASHPLRGQLQAWANRSAAVAEVLRGRERWLAAVAVETAGEGLDADALAAVVTGLIEVNDPSPDPRRILDHAVARLVGVRSVSTHE